MKPPTAKAGEMPPFYPAIFHAIASEAAAKPWPVGTQFLRNNFSLANLRDLHIKFYLM
jgi:hypothetical protein